MPTPPYSTAAEVKDTDLSRLVGQAGWADADVESRIKEGDSIIMGCIAQLGYVTDFGTIALTPLFVRSMSVLYGRAASYRDLFHRSRDTSTSDSSKMMFDRFDTEMKKLKDGEIELIDVGTNLPFPVVPIDQRVQSNTENVPRALTMDEPENQHIHGSLYSDQEVLGEAQGDHDLDDHVH